MAHRTELQADIGSRDVESLLGRIATRDYRLAVVGLRYTDIPLPLTTCTVGFLMLALDMDPQRVAQLDRGESFVKRVPADAIRSACEKDLIVASTDFAQVTEADATVIASTTPLTKHREPDLSLIVPTVWRARL